MNCLVTAGPSYEPLDQVRRLTNVSTGELGVRLCNNLVEAGHRVVLLLGQMATYAEPARADLLCRFGTSAELHQLLTRFAAEDRFGAVFHAAAVCDFRPARVWHGASLERAQPVQAGKISSEVQPLWVELVATPKLIGDLRALFPQAWIVGWKYEVDGQPAEALGAGWKQIRTYRIDACVVNGPAYGEGFALLEPGQAVRAFSDRATLSLALAQRCSEREKAAQDAGVRSADL